MMSPSESDSQASVVDIQPASETSDESADDDERRKVMNKPC
jgi:hypothetical protein